MQPRETEAEREVQGGVVKLQELFAFSISLPFYKIDFNKAGLSILGERIWTENTPGSKKKNKVDTSSTLTNIASLLYVGLRYG